MAGFNPSSVTTLHSLKFLTHSYLYWIVKRSMVECIVEDDVESVFDSQSSGLSDDSGRPSRASRLDLQLVGHSASN